ncbi:hypothetical protein [Cohnella sp.]|uniref:hypothetical protein n=1 Tax=Cohnella sp. TaxID=1883426 RepID=UPI00356666AE
MSLMDALFYWLQMKWVSSTHPDDEAARETLVFFAQILSEDHELMSYDVSAEDAAKIHVTYSKADGSTRTVWFDREAVEQLGRDLFGQPSALDDDEVLDNEDEEELK